DRLVLETTSGPVAVSLRPERPWMGTPRMLGHRGAARGPFAAACTRVLGGTPIASIEKDPADRVAIVSLADGHRLAIELAVHGANAVLIDRDGNVLETARLPRAGRDR